MIIPIKKPLNLLKIGTIMNHHYITDSAWNKILIFLKTKKNVYIGNVDNCKQFMEAVYWMMRSGAQWRELPSKYDQLWNSVFHRFNEWSKKNIWAELMQYCIVDPDLEYLLLDSTVVRAHACAAGYKKNKQHEEGLGRSKGGFSSKAHVATDSLGLPLKIIVTAGQTNDITQAIDLVKDIKAQYALGDKGYDSDTLREALKKNDCIPVIPGRSNRIIAITIDKDIYKFRNEIECFFSKIKHYRRIFSRFDKSLRNYLSFLSFAGAILWLR